MRTVKIKDKIDHNAHFTVFRNSSGHVVNIIMFYYRDNAIEMVQEVVTRGIYPYGEVLSYKQLRQHLHKESIVKYAFNFLP